MQQHDLPNGLQMPVEEKPFLLRQSEDAIEPKDLNPQSRPFDRFELDEGGWSDFSDYGLD